MQSHEISQALAVRRAWAAAAEAEGKAHLGDRDGAQALAAVAEAWARVASQLPVVVTTELGESVPLFEQLPDAHATDERVSVPVPRPLRVTDDQLAPDALDLGARIAVEQAAAADVLLGVDPLDPRVPLDDTIVLAPPMVAEPSGTPSSNVAFCRNCGPVAREITWHGGAWVHENGRRSCVSR